MNKNQGQPIPVDISQAEDIFCQQCNAPYFMEGMRMKRLSMIVSPTGKEEIVNVPVLLCMQCGLELGTQPVVPSEDA
ncbi:MAG: hypothetical protein KAS32_03170 [Candidatus Peribacteraceae bacterium]|nr:hypothetical protein [Candidatus Peribacteraceae bacterium]